MNQVELVKSFFKVNGLNWTGLLSNPCEDDELRLAKDEDFETIENLDYLIDFGEDGQIVLNAEIDIMTFRINGEAFDYAVICYAREGNEKACEERDLSEEWVKFQLNEKGLVFATIFKNKCNEVKEKIENETNQHTKRLSRKIEYLTRSIGKAQEDRDRKIGNINKLENIVNDI